MSHSLRSNVLLIATLLCVACNPVRATAQAGAGKPRPPETRSQRPKLDGHAAEEVFEAGVGFQQRKEYAKAIAQYQKLRAVMPDDSSVLWNLGSSAYFAYDYPLALATWKHEKQVEPKRWEVRGKLILVYQAQGDTKGRARERAELVALRKSGKLSELTAKPSFCCDQFVVSGRNVFAYDYFELSGDRAVRYAFLVLKPDGTEDYRISLGSYKLDNDIAHEMGTLKPGQRLYHLDGYYDKGKRHSTFGFYNSEPTYDATKKDVLAVLNGSKKPVSGSVRP